MNCPPGIPLVPSAILWGKRYRMNPVFINGYTPSYAHLVCLFMRIDWCINKKALFAGSVPQKPYCLPCLFHWTAFLCFCSRGSFNVISVVNCVMECAIQGLFYEYIVGSLLTHHLSTSGMILFVPETELNK